MSLRGIVTACSCAVIAIIVLVLVVNSSGGATNSAAQPTAERPADAQSSTTPNATLPVLSISDAKVDEGGSGVTDVPFTVALSRPSDQPVSVVYTTSNGSATVDNGDYVASRGTLTFLPGEMSKIITVRLSGDTRGERNELFQVTLSNALHATIGTATGTGTIINDNQQPNSAPAPIPTFAAIGGTTVLPVPTPLPTPLPTPTSPPAPTAAPSNNADRSARARGNALYLPWVQRTTTADLIIESITLFPNTTTIVAGAPVEVRVTIRNIGGAPVTAPFWVDLYVNPARVPQANMLWNSDCGVPLCEGATWHVTQTLAPDQRITLSTMQPEHTHSRWEGWLPAGTTALAAYVDSWNAAGTNGAILEDNENNNSAEFKDLTVTGTNPPSLEGPASQISRRP